MANKALFFRSDTRLPMQIFVHGFTPRNGVGSGPSMREIKSKGIVVEGSIDVDMDTTVCITRDFAAAALFPFADADQSSCVYVMELDLAEVYNIGAHQYNFASEFGSMDDPKRTFRTLYAQERAVDQVAGSAIVGAVVVQRQKSGRQRQYKVLGLMENAGFTGSADALEAVKKVAAEMAAGDRWRDTPRSEDGYAKSDPVSLHLGVPGIMHALRQLVL